MTTLIILIAAVVLGTGVVLYGTSLFDQPIPTTNMIKCPQYSFSHKAVNGTFECLKEYYTVEGYIPSTQYETDVINLIDGMITQVNLSKTTVIIRLMDNNDYDIGNTTEHMYVGEHVRIGLLESKPVTCTPNKIELYHQTEMENGTAYYGDNATKIIKSGHYDGYTNFVVGAIPDQCKSIRNYMLIGILNP